MKRRVFLKSLAATAATPLMPLKALATIAPEAAIGTSQPYQWASFIARVHNKASPAMLKRLLKFDETMAQQVYAELIKTNVVSAPNAYGISQAINPFKQAGMAAFKPTQLAEKSTHATLQKRHPLEPSSEDFESTLEDSQSINQDLQSSGDEHTSRESQTGETDPNGIVELAPPHSIP